ncbi:unnamed protein product [Symbiodinium sp. CCMP2592]|nr:unnamed protein product [Symbiodinium sp. CCMP2592]
MENLCCHIPCMLSQPRHTSQDDDGSQAVKEEPKEETSDANDDATAPPTKKRRVRTRREKLQEAAKARLRRMTTKKKRRAELEESFLTDSEVQIRKTQKITIKQDAAWYSETEMKTELKWSRISGAKKACEKDAANLIRHNQYDNVLEYWVVVRETGQHEQIKEISELERTRK